MNCSICNKKIYGRKKKYCSSVCSKRAWYVRKKPLSYWGKRTNLFWESQTGIGTRWEEYISNILNIPYSPFKRGADIVWKDKTIDVKASNLYKRKNKRGKPVLSEQKGYWTFKCSHNIVRPDYFLAVCLIDNEPYKLYLIPSSVFPKSGCVIGWDCKKYSDYIFNPSIFSY